MKPRICTLSRGYETDQPRLVVLRALKLGDLLVAVPALAALRRGFPQHRIVLAAPAWLEPLIELIDSIDELFDVPGLEAVTPESLGEVNVAVNLHGNGEESRTFVERLGARVNIVHRTATYPDGLPWADGIHERERWARLVAAYGAPADPQEISIRVPARRSAHCGAAVVHVGAAQASRFWPEDRFARVVSELRHDGHRVVLTGGSADVDRARAVARLSDTPAVDVLAGRIDLLEFASIVAAAPIVVSVDTGAAHLASAYGTPSVVLFGPSPPEEWGPPPGPHIVLTDASLRRGERFADSPDPALLAVSAAQVIAAARLVQRMPRAQPASRTAR